MSRHKFKFLENRRLHGHRRQRNTVFCTCPRCSGVPTADPKWGFDTAKVPAMLCMACDKPIGAELYTLDTSLARFGQMLFYHQRCL